MPVKRLKNFGKCEIRVWDNVKTPRFPFKAFKIVFDGWIQNIRFLSWKEPRDNAIHLPQESV